MIMSWRQHRCKRLCVGEFLNVFGELARVKMSNNTKGQSRDRNICRIGCGRPGQGDYGWKGPAFNCCFGTVACLVEHKRPVRHASVARTCEYLPHQWNAPLSPHLPYKPHSWPSYSLHFQLFELRFLLTWGGDRNTHTYMRARSTCNACWELFSNSCKWDSRPVLFSSSR